MTLPYSLKLKRPSETMLLTAWRAVSGPPCRTLALGIGGEYRRTDVSPLTNGPTHMPAGCGQWFWNTGCPGKLAFFRMVRAFLVFRPEKRPFSRTGRVFWAFRPDFWRYFRTKGVFCLLCPGIWRYFRTKGDRRGGGREISEQVGDEDGIRQKVFVNLWKQESYGETSFYCCCGGVLGGLCWGTDGNGAS